MPGSVSEGTTAPGFKNRLSSRPEAAGGKPRAGEPIHRANLLLDSSSDFNFGHLHGGELYPADFPARCVPGDDEADVVAPSVMSSDVGPVPHAAQPLPIAKTVALGPVDKTGGGAHGCAYAKGFMDPDVGDTAWR